MRKALAVSIVLALAPAAHAQDVARGKAKVEEVCSACHGLNGVSVADHIPNLAGQRALYLETQLKNFKDGIRKAPSQAHPIATMAAMAVQLSAQQISDVAAYFSSLPGAMAGGAKSQQLPNVAKTNLTFPENYKATFVHYHTLNFPATKQLRRYFANPAAIAAAKAGKPLPEGSFILAEVYSAKVDAEGKPVAGADGFFVPEKHLFYTAMGTGAGWGNGVPDALRNGNWNYGVFTLEKQHRPINQAECYACHKPLDKDSFVFTLRQLAAAK